MSNPFKHENVEQLRVPEHAEPRQPKPQPQTGHTRGPEPTHLKLSHEITHETTTHKLTPNHTHRTYVVVVVTCVVSWVRDGKISTHTPRPVSDVKR